MVTDREGERDERDERKREEREERILMGYMECKGSILICNKHSKVSKVVLKYTYPIAIYTFSCCFAFLPKFSIANYFTSAILVSI